MELRLLETVVLDLLQVLQDLQFPIQAVVVVDLMEALLVLEAHLWVEQEMQEVEQLLHQVL